MRDSFPFKRAVVFVYIVQKVGGGCTAFRMGVCHDWKDYLQLCALIFSSSIRTSTGEVSLSIRSDVACVFDHRKMKVCSLLPVRATAGDQLEKFGKIKEMAASGWPAGGSRTQVVVFVQMTAWIQWWARWILTVGVCCWLRRAGRTMLGEQWQHRPNYAASATVCTCRSLFGAGVMHGGMHFE